ncbi:MAG TPA: DUF2723 domain-containing protein [Candidatus Eisenbacteria bacterium]|nr:DUF2723 domain-containing protein [Candidatus Eisenbacteria bacterium]
MNPRAGHLFFALLALAVPLVAFTLTTTPTVPFWDSGEYIATSYILGLPHPPGNPVYTMIGRVVSLIPIESVAFRVNWMSALASALACLFTFLFTVRALRRTFAPESPTMTAWLACELGGLVAAFFVAFGKSFWDSAIEAEVYALSSCLGAFIVWLGFNWWDHQGEPGNDKLLLLIMYIVGISTGVHLGTVLVFLPLVVLFAMVNPKVFLSSKFIAPAAFLTFVVGLLYVNGSLELGIPGGFFLFLLGAAALLSFLMSSFFLRRNLIAWWVLVFVIGASVQIFLLIRSQQMPAINEGDPSTIGAWLEYLGRKQYGPSNPFERRAEVWQQINFMYLRYVGQQWPLIERIGELGSSAFWVRLVNSIPFLLFFWGAWWNYRRDRTTFWFFLAANVVMGPGLIFYLNFTDHEVRERDYFFTSSYHFMAVWMGMGAAAVFQAIARVIHPASLQPARGAASAPAARAAIAEPVGANPGGNGGLTPEPYTPLPSSTGVLAGLGLAALTLVGISLLPMKNGWFTHDRSGFYIAHNYAYNMLTPLEKDAIVFTNGDNDTFPLWYIQEVEGLRKDVRVVNLSLLNTPWYIKQLRDLEPKVPLSYTDDELAALTPYRDEQTGNIVWVKDLAVKNIVETNRWKRPLYLAVTVPDQMGLEKRLSLEGLVFRVNPQDAGRSVDVQRTMDNLYRVFRYEGLLDKNRNYDTAVYKDENAYRLVQNYTAAHVQVGYQLHMARRPQDAIRVLEDAAKISPDFPGLLEYLGRLYDESGRVADAERVYLEGSRRFPDAPEFPFHLGVIYYRTGRTEDGIVQLRRAVDMNQQYFDWFSALFTALWEQGRREEAVDVLRTWVRAHPEDRDGAAYLQEFEESLRVRPRAAPGARIPESR